MKKNKIVNMLLGIFVLLLVSLAMAGVEVTPADKVVVDVDYGGLDDDDDSIVYTKTMSFTNTDDTVCPADCDAECDTCCTDPVCTSCITTSCAVECADPESDLCHTCIVSNCGAECSDCITCHTDCDACVETAKEVALTLVGVSTEYTVELSEEAFDLVPGETKSITVTVTVPVDVDAGSHEVGSVEVRVDDVLSSTVGLETMVKSMLKLDNIKFYVDGSKEDTFTESGEKTSDVAPGQEVEFKFNIENLFDNGYNDGNLDDIELTLELADSDDEEDYGDEIEESDKFDLDAGEDTTVVFGFQIPGDAKEQTYELVIKMEGDDETGAKHDVEWSLFLDVDRKKDDVRLERASLQTSTIVCGGETMFKVKVTNYGSNDQDDVALSIVNEALGINVQEMDIELDNDPEDDDNSYTRSVPVVVDEDFAAGTYTLDVRVYVDGDEEVDHRLVQLTVVECAEDVVEEDEEEGDVIVQELPGDDETFGDGITGGTVVETVETSQSGGMTAFMIVVVVLLVILIALMLGVLLKK